MKIILIPGSLQKNSFNLKTLHAVSHQIKKINPAVEFEILNLKAMEMPLFDEDLEKETGVPNSIKETVEKIKKADGLIISSPEYNGSIAGGFKNFIDWTSRVSPHPWTKKPVLLFGATPGPMAALRGLWHTRVPLEALGAILYSDMIGVPNAHETFNDLGDFKDPKFSTRVEGSVSGFLDFVLKLK